MVGGQSLPLYRLPKHYQRRPRRGPGRSRRARCLNGMLGVQSAFNACSMPGAHGLHQELRMHTFEYLRPSSVAEAIEEAFRGAADGKFLAGGMTLIPIFKQRLARPTRLIDLSRIQELNGIYLDEGGLVIGAMTKHSTVAGVAGVQRAIPALAMLAASIGDPQVRNRGTLGAQSPTMIRRRTILRRSSRSERPLSLIAAASQPTASSPGCSKLCSSPTSWWWPSPSRFPSWLVMLRCDRRPPDTRWSA